MKLQAIISTLICVFLLPFQLSADSVDPFAFDNISGKEKSGNQWKPVIFGIYVGVNVGEILAGGQKNFLETAYDFVPDSQVSVNFDTGFFLFPFRYVGIEGSYTFYGNTAVEDYRSAEDRRITYSTFEYWALSGGLAFRIPFHFNAVLDLSIIFSGGVTWTSLGYQGDYKRYVADQGGTLENSNASARGYGGYGSFGADLFIIRHLFIGAGVKYTYQNTKFKDTPEVFDGHLLSAWIRAGVSF